MNKLSRRFIGNWAKLLPSKRKRQQQRRRLMAECLEDRRLLAVDFNALHNYSEPKDVNGDQKISPIDVLGIVNHINRGDHFAAQPAAHGEGEGEGSKMMPDVTGDGMVSPLDALLVINHLLAEGEAGNVVTFSHQATDLAGNAVTSVSIGQTFVLQTIVQDERSSPQGVFAGYFDLDYDESLVQVNMRESQTIQFGNSPEGGTYRLGFNGNTTQPIEFVREVDFFGTIIRDPNVIAPLNVNNIRDALLALPNINPGDVEVVPFTGGTVNGGSLFNYEVKFGAQYAGTDVPKLVSSDVQLLNAGTITIFNTSDELLVPTLAELQVDNPSTTAADRANLVARSEQTRSFTFAFPKYSSGQSGLFGNGGPPAGMFIDEIGAFTSNQTPGDGTPEVLVEVQVTALAGGTARFLGNPSDQAPDHDVLVFGLDNAVSTADIGFMLLDLPITADITAVDDGPFTVDEGSTNNNINVLANDTVFNPQGVDPIIIQVNGAPVSANQTISLSNGSLTFLGSSKTGPNFHYTPATGDDVSFTYTISNGQANGQGKTDMGNVTIDVIPEAPELVISGPTSLTVVEDTVTKVSSAISFSLTDPEVTPVSVNLNTTGSGTLSQTSFQGTLSDAISFLNSVTYTPVANSTASDTINISASAGTLSDTHTVNVTITPVNDPPEFANLPASLTAFLDQTLALPSFSVTDPDSTVTVTLSVDQGTLSNNGGTGQSINTSGGPGTFSVSGISYTPPAGIIGSATLTVQAADGTATPVSQTIPISVISPLLPYAATDFITINEGDVSGSIDVLLNDLAKSDKANLSIKETTLPIPAAQGSVTQSGSTFTYTPPNADFFGTTSFTYTIEDTGDPGDGDSVGTVNITVNPVNDPPVITTPGSTPTFAEDSNAMSISGLSVTDIDDSSVDVTLSVTNGTLNAGGQSGSTIQVSNSSLSGLTYKPNANYFGSDTLSVSANDGTAPSVNDTVNITINPINDPPTILVPGQQTFFTGVSSNLFTSIPSPFQIDDIDAGTNDVQLDLTIADGTLTISDQGDASVATIAGGIRLTGSVAEINTALSSGVTYSTIVPTALNTTRPLTATVNDLGNTGTLDPNLSGAAQVSETKTVDIEVLDFVPIDILGRVFQDLDGDSNKDSSEPAIEGINMTLSGTDFQGNPVNLSINTDAQGFYSFPQLRPNAEGQPYTITEQQPALIQTGPQGNQATVNLDIRGNVSVSSGSLSFGAGNFEAEFADFWDVFDSSDVAPANSGILFGMEATGQDWAIFFGQGWDATRYGNARLSLNQNGDAGVLTVFDSQLGQDRTANVSVNNGSLTYRGRGVDRVYRVIGGSELLNSVSAAQNEAEGGDATTDITVYTNALDSIFG